MTAAMILCAGLGTRLRPLTDWLAKPMVPIGDAPAVQHIAAHVRGAGAGIERLVVNVHHRPDDVRAWATREGVTVSEEHELLGTAGGVQRAAALLEGGDVIVWNGDILSDLPIPRLVAAHHASGASATLAIVARAGGEGNVGMTEDGRIVRLRRESFGVETRSGDFVGVQLLGDALRRTLPERGCLVGDVYIPALRAGSRLAAHTVTSTFVDVGSVAAYVAANRTWLRARGLSSWTAASALVDADVRGSIIGASARVDASAVRCIVWPGAHVREPMADMIVCPGGVVPMPPGV